MSERHIISYDPENLIIDDKGFAFLEMNCLTGVSLWVKFEPDGSAILRNDTPVDPLMSMNAQERNYNQGAKWGDGKKVASIPMDIWQRELSDAIVQEDSKYVSKWLNDADRKGFRTFEGNV